MLLERILGVVKVLAIVVPALGLAGGLVSVVWPRFAWQAAHWARRWAYRAAVEPSQAGLVLMRVRGVVWVIVFLALLAFGLVLNLRPDWLYAFME